MLMKINLFGGSKRAFMTIRNEKTDQIIKC